jgi:hypothetical protein
MPRVRYAVQILEPGRPRSNRKWTTLRVFKRRAVAEVVLKSVRQDRLNVAELSRVWPIHTVSAHAVVEA